MSTDDSSASIFQGGKKFLNRIIQALMPKPKTRKELMRILRQAKHYDILDADALRMIEGVIQVSEQCVDDIMIPRSQMTIIEHDTPFKDIIETVTESHHSRFPVIAENRDEIIGILLAKDLLQYKEETNPFNIKTCIRPVVFVPESKRLDVLLREFRLNRNHMAVVVDEYGSISGLVTIEDILEEIVGEIEDETDSVDSEDNIQKISKTQYNISALTTIEDFNAYFNTNMSDEEFDTIGGLVIQQFTRLPKKGESIRFDGFEFKVIKADKRRIHLFRLTALKPAS